MINTIEELIVLDELVDKEIRFKTHGLRSNYYKLLNKLQEKIRNEIIRYDIFERKVFNNEKKEV